MRFLLALMPLLACWAALSLARWYGMARHYEPRFRFMATRDFQKDWDLLRFAPHPALYRLWFLVSIGAAILSAMGIAYGC